jgi:hypothetical protein
MNVSIVAKKVLSLSGLRSPKGSSCILLGHWARDCVEGGRDREGGGGSGGRGGARGGRGGGYGRDRSPRRDGGRGFDRDSRRYSFFPVISSLFPSLLLILHALSS